MKKTLLGVVVLLNLILGAHSQDGQGICGTNVHTSPQTLRVVSTSDDDVIGTWPWMVSAGKYQAGKWKHFCGGSVISSRHVLTAAHCTVRNNLLLKFGDKDLADNSDDVFGAEIRSIKRTFRHPKYDLRSRTFYFDVAIWEVAPIDFNTYIKPICLPPFASTFTERYSGDHVTLTGWGQMGGTSQGNGVLRMVGIRIYDTRYCNATHSLSQSSNEYNSVQQSLPNLFSPNLLCAGYERGGGSCFGDSGSPIAKFIEVSSHGPHYLQLGIVSGGIGGCGNPKFPAVYVRLEDPEVYDFIQSVVNGLPVKEEPEEQVDDVINIDFALNVGKIAVEALFKKNLADPNFNPASHTPGYNTSLFTNAAAFNNIEVMRELLARGANPNLPDLHTKNTALHHGCKYGGHIDVIQFLLSLPDINIEARNHLGGTPLGVCAINGFFNGVKALVDHGANVNARDEVQGTPLMFAIQAKDERSSMYLIDKGANIAANTNSNRNALHIAAIYMNETTKVAERLINLGISANQQDRSGYTPFSLAAGYGNLKMIRFLYNSGRGDPSIKNNDDLTPFANAAAYNHAEVVQFLLEKSRTYLNQPDNDGNTPLHLAAHWGFDKTVRILLQYGADRKVKNQSGKTPEQMARDNGKTDTANLIMSYR